MGKYSETRYANMIPTFEPAPLPASEAAAAQKSNMRVYETLADLPATSTSKGNTAFVKATNKLYVWNGIGWYLVAEVTNASPSSITGVNSTYTLATDGTTATTITAVTTDPEGMALTWSSSVTAGSLNGTTVSNVDNVFTVTPHASNDTTFTLTFSVTDGVNVVSYSSAFTLSFMPEIDLLVIGGGGSGAMRHGGGGGAGEYRENTYFPLAGVTYTVTVGAGGAAVTGWSGSQGPANPGTLSRVLASDASTDIQSGGGGAGPGYGYQAAVSDGGSTGGSSNPAANLRTPTDLQTPPGYRNIGGNFTSGDPGSGGGGGAGGAGGNGSHNNGGAGGIGKQWVDGNWYAAGGSGSQKYGTTTSASGVGGTSGPAATASTGAVNTGSGGGGMFNSSGSPAPGADGTVRFRVLTAKTQPQNVTGSPTITTAGTYTYYSFTGSGSFGWN
jgi:hypothetical protein